MDGRRIVQQALDAQRVRDSHSTGPGLSPRQVMAVWNSVSIEGTSPGPVEGRELVRQALRAQAYMDSHARGGGSGLPEGPRVAVGGSVPAPTTRPDVPVTLPASEKVADWAEAFAVANLVPGPPVGAPWVVMSIRSGGWLIKVKDRRGDEREASVPTPRNPQDREDIALLIVSLLQPMDFTVPKAGTGAPITPKPTKKLSTQKPAVVPADSDLPSLHMPEADPLRVAGRAKDLFHPSGDPLHLGADYIRPYAVDDRMGNMVNYFDYKTRQYMDYGEPVGGDGMFGGWGSRVVESEPTATNDPSGDVPGERTSGHWEETSTGQRVWVTDNPDGTTTWNAGGGNGNATGGEITNESEGWNPWLFQVDHRSFASTVLARRDDYIGVFAHGMIRTPMYWR